MFRRKVAALLLFVAGMVGLLVLPAPSDAAKGGQPGPPPHSQGNGPSQPRCDPQPEKGNGPPPGKGTKKCASR
jgi:hypothetical protein